MEPKTDLHILNSREKKEILKIIKDCWGADWKPDVLLQSDKGKIYLISRGLGDIDWTKLNIDRVGLYVARLKDKTVRLTIEGSQIIGPLAKKNIIEIDNTRLKAWFRGEDLDIKSTRFNFVILKHNNDFVGCGKTTTEKILNFVPKARRAELI